ncbi:tripartite tricarboxylate transporter TctB family protein [Actinoplanes sp. NPDC049265]|uniref:tripartite tricarboxylate transporter TctB family protein n=1 Tax=Actinoplanes sp. NPDC049265 TaxID=3363902 RepID=UPI003718FA35
MTLESEPERRPVAGRRSGWVLPLILLLAGVGLLLAALNAAGGDFSPQGPRLAPVLVTGGWVVIAGIYLLRFRRESEEAEEKDETISWRTPLGVVGCLVGFALALEYAGFVISAFLFVIAVSRVLGSRGLVRDVIVALVLPLAVYFAFTRLLDIFLPAGVFPL